MSKSVQAVRLTQRIRGTAYVPSRLEAMPMKPDSSHYDADWAPRSPPLEADARTEALRRPSRGSDPCPRGGRDRAEPIVVRLVRRFEWNADSVFAAWVDPVIAGQWLFATAARPMVSAAIDSRAGGSFCLCEQRAEEIVEHSGTYVEFMPPRRLAFTLSTPDHPTATRLDVDIEPRQSRMRTEASARERPRRPRNAHPPAVDRDALRARRHPSRRRVGSRSTHRRRLRPME